MKKLFRYSAMITVVHVVSGVLALCQDQQSQEPPKLEIPEITIIGKKAITLPFARKGELYDVDMYQAPPPDSSLLLQTGSLILPKGSLPRYEQQEQPWRWSAEGFMGSFGAAGGRGFVDYRSQRWLMAGDFGGRSDNGHVTNANSSSFSGGLDASTTLVTDNAVMRTLRASFGGAFHQETYGLFGITSSEIRRRKKDFTFHADIHSLHRQSNALDLGIETHSVSLMDSQSGGDSSATALSPKLYGSYLASVGNVTIAPAISYVASSLDYQHSVESPSMLNLVLRTTWHTAVGFAVEVGGKFVDARNSRGENHTLVAPLGAIQWKIDTLTAFRVWFEPDMEFHSYDNLLEHNPYLHREISIDPQRMPLRFGSSVQYHGGVLSFDVRGSYSTFSNHELMIADSGRIHLEYTEASATRLDLDGEFVPTPRLRISYGGSIVSAHETGSSVQLPMIPKALLRGGAEVIGPLSTTIWLSADFQSSKNVDRVASQSLKDVLLLNAGASLHAISRLVLSADLKNVLNTSYELWRGYPAPGITFTVAARLNIQ